MIFRAFPPSLLFLFCCSMLASGLSAQSCGLTGKRQLKQLEAVVFKSSALERPKNYLFPAPIAAKALPPGAPVSSVFLPRWSAEDLPFFCKIEHDWSKVRGRVPVKFRLGSVDYVDWLEGKNWDKTRY